MNQTELYAHIDAIVALHLASQAEYEDRRDPLSRVAFAHEFQTVGVSLPRRSGKTMYIVSRATPNDIILVHNYERKRALRDAVATVLTPSDRVVGPWNRVYIDEPSLCSNDLAALISPFAGVAKQFILLGTP